MKKYLHVLFSSLLSGFLIAVGCIVYLTLLANDQKIIGSLLFGLGLFTIIHFRLHLYTGKIGKLLDNKPKYLLEILVCLIGNFAGVIIISLLAKLTRISDIIIPEALNLVNTKQADNWYSILILSILCGIMIYVACDGHIRCDYSSGKFAFVFCSISIFILAGFEHCIANSSYYTLAGVFNLKVVLYFILMIIGNAIGAILMDGTIKLKNKFKPE